MKHDLHTMRDEMDLSDIKSNEKNKNKYTDTCTYSA